MREGFLCQNPCGPAPGSINRAEPVFQKRKCPWKRYRVTSSLLRVAIREPLCPPASIWADRPSAFRWKPSRVLFRRSSSNRSRTRGSHPSARPIWWCPLSSRDDAGWSSRSPSGTGDRPRESGTDRRPTPRRARDTFAPRRPFPQTSSDCPAFAAQRALRRTPGRNPRPPSGKCVRYAGWARPS